MRAGLTRYLIGAFSLAVGTLFIGMSAAAALGSIIHSADLEPWFMLFLLLQGAACVGFAIYLWYRAIKVTAGEDVFADQRGLLIALMLITALATFGAMGWAMITPDFWRDSIAGMLSAD